ALGFRLEMQSPVRPQLVRGQKTVASEQRREGNPAEAATRLPEEVATIHHMPQSTNTNSFRLKITRHAFARPRSFAYRFSASRSAAVGLRPSARRNAAFTSPARTARCFAIVSMRPLLKSASACKGESVSVRLSTCIDGSAQSSTVMNGCGFERTRNRYTLRR